MGLLDKVKNLFTEEIEEEVPIRKEVKKVEIAKPYVEPVKEQQRVKEEVKPIEVAKEETPQVSESSALNKEEKFKFPVYFDDKDFEDLPKPKVKPKEEPKVETAYQGVNPVKIESKKRFKVSPVISPVYGVLDKNYNKEDLKIKAEKSKKYHPDEKITVDDVRNKAYGTLEEELENTLLTQTVVQEKPKVETPEIDIFEELENTTTKPNHDLLMSDITFEKEEVTIETEEKPKEDITASLEEELENQKKKIDELNDYIHSIQTEAEVLKPEPVQEEAKGENIIEEVIKEEEVDTTEKQEEKPAEEGDLFSLIDSMYEKRDE